LTGFGGCNAYEVGYDIAGTDSGFEGLTTVYYDTITVVLVHKQFYFS